MSYQHDIFLSYKHNPLIKKWIHNHLLQLMPGFVEEGIVRDVDVFIDDKISTGDSWILRLRSAVACSRCLVPIWTVQYFNSEWCRKETGIMLRREERTGFRTLQEPGGLIIPIVLFDTQRFPDRVHGIQQRDCRAFFYPHEGFEKEEAYGRFVKSIEQFSRDVVAAILKAPAWQSTWVSEEWGSSVEADLHPKAPTPQISEQNVAFVDTSKPLTVVDQFLALNNVNSAYQFGQGYLDSNGYEYALLIFEYMLHRLGPTHEWYSRLLANKAYALIGRGKFDPAIQSLLTVKKMRIDDRFHPWHAVALAYAYFRVGNKSEFSNWISYARAKPLYNSRLSEFVRLYPEIADELTCASAGG